MTFRNTIVEQTKTLSWPKAQLRLGLDSVFVFSSLKETDRTADFSSLGPDFRNAVVAARSAQSEWAGRSAYNRSQILYRIAEIMEGRRAQFISELELQGLTKKQAEEEINATIDRWVYYAGWCDKYQQIFSSVNPVASNHFNFSILEPMGVVASTAPEESSLLGISTIIATAYPGHAGL